MGADNNNKAGVLADVYEPLVLADGTRIDPTTGSVMKDKAVPPPIDVPSNTQARDLVLRTRRKLADLPLPPDKMNPISIVLMYTLYGLSDAEIALATSLSETSITFIKQHKVFRTFKEQLMSDVLEAEQDRIAKLLREHAEDAARKVVTHINSEDEKISLAAARDLLDRSGHKAKDEKRLLIDDRKTLRIEFIKSSTDESIDAITGDFTEIDNALEQVEDA